jgi:uncharacterized membrane protein HdeD (DUF308 family)
MNGMQDARSCPPISEIDGADRERKWFLALGIFAILLGAVALSLPVVTTVASVLFLGSLLLVSGIVQIYQTLKAEKGKEFFTHLVISIFYIVLGGLMVANPGIGAVSLALAMASFFMVAGIFRIIGAVTMRFRSWGWVVFNGIVAFLLGLLIWAEWPFSGLWVIGLFMAIEMIINGWGLVMFAAAARGEIGQIRRQCVAQAPA